MPGFEFQNVDLSDVCLIKNFFVGDERGVLSKFYERRNFDARNLKFHCDETFFSVSQVRVIRGLHFQLKRPQIKIVTCLTGEIWDVVVDLRPKSKTYKKWQAFVLNPESHMSLYIPRGFAHGFLALKDNSMLLYQCDGLYEHDNDSGIIFNDKDINVQWPIDLQTAILSDRDLNLMTFKQYEDLHMNGKIAIIE